MKIVTLHSISANDTILKTIMLKRILFTVMTFLLVYSAVLVGYKIFQPHEEETHTVAHNALDYETLREYTLNSGRAAIHYYFFCDSTSDDCIYVQNTVIKSTASATELNLDSLIEYVELAPVDDNILLTLLREDWGLTTYPAFLACHVENEKIVLDNHLEWNPAQPMSVDDLTNWLRLNGLYKTEAIEVPIETPNS